MLSSGRGAWSEVKLAAVVMVCYVRGHKGGPRESV
jgi:hypothetical protein